MWDFWDSNSFEVEKDVKVDVDIDVSLDFDVDPKLDSNVDVDHKYDVDVDIKGNDATFFIDIEALGDNSSTQLNLTVLVTDDLSMITASGYAAVD
ncbi:MAG: hypothetical protein IRZ13_01630 [Acetobacteraceae bacterium]|nr:hypothetical protein [Acetobacteraceae bacterium]